MQPPRLLAINPAGSKPREYPLAKDESTVGSDEGNALVMAERGVSRRHAVIRRRAGRYELADLNSANGTFINGERVRAAVILKDGDELRFGAARFVFLNERAPSAQGAGVGAGTKPRRSVAKAVAIVVGFFAAGFGIAECLINRGRVSETLQDITGRLAGGAAPAHRVGSPVPGTTAAPAATASIVSDNAAESSTENNAAPTEPEWLARVNYYRAMVKLPPVTEEPALSDGDLKHARYLVENYLGSGKSGTELGGAAHQEDAFRPWYTPEGFNAAQSSDVAYGCTPFKAQDEIDGWVSGPFHRLSVMNPGLRSVGFGSYTKEDCWAAALDVHLVAESRPLSQPVEFPPDGATIPLLFAKGEWPDPLTSCPGYTAPTGLPVTIAFGSGVDVRFSAHSLTEGGRPIEYCAFDATTYKNPDSFAEDWGRNVLRGFGAAVLIPREPLRPGASYAVSMTVGGETYTWSFAVGLKEAQATAGESASR